MPKLKFDKNTQEYCEVTETFRFNENYNKKLTNEYFTTIRKIKKDVKIGDIANVCLVGSEPFKVKIIEIRKMILSKLPSLLTYIDSGLNKADFTKLIQELHKVDVARGHIYLYLLKRMDMDLFSISEVEND